MDVKIDIISVATFMSVFCSKPEEVKPLRPTLGPRKWVKGPRGRLSSDQWEAARVAREAELAEMARKRAEDLAARVAKRQAKDAAKQAKREARIAKRIEDAKAKDTAIRRARAARLQALAILTPAPPAPRRVPFVPDRSTSSGAHPRYPKKARAGRPDARHPAGGVVFEGPSVARPPEDQAVVDFENRQHR